MISSPSKTDTSVSLSWSAPSSGPAITGYFVQYRQTGASSWSTFSDGTSSGTAVTVTGLNHNTSYDFQVAAVNADGTGAYSSPITATTKKNFVLALSAGSSAFTLLGSPVTVDSSLTITDETSGSISAAKVQISSGFQAGDTLALPTGGAAAAFPGITGSYNASNGILTLSGSGTASVYQAALRAVTFTTTNTSTAVRNVDVTLGNAIAYNGHFYEVVTNSVTWPTARSGALAKSLFGIPGYLVNITSAGENQFILSKVSTTAWIGASDSGAEGTWKWMDGPEAGTTFWSGTGTGSAQGGQYANWNVNEPNDAGGNEDYASIYSGLGVQDGKWNDYGGSGPYIVEYGNPSAVISFSGTRTLSINPAPQTITFSPIQGKTFGDAPFVLTNAVASSGLPVTFASSNTNVATVSGSTVTIVGAGQSTITANQQGNATYAAASSQSQTLRVLAGVYGNTDLQTFDSVDTNSVPRLSGIWTSTDDLNHDTNNIYSDSYGGTAPDFYSRIGNYYTRNQKTALQYRFEPGNSDRLVFRWKQLITRSDTNLPALDRFGWDFTSGTNILFSLKMAQFVDSNGNNDWDKTDESTATPAEPLAGDALGADSLILGDRPGGSVDSNGVSLFHPSKLVVAGYGAGTNGARLGTTQQPNFLVIDRNDENDTNRSFWYQMTVIVDLREKKWWAQVFANGTINNLMGDAGADLKDPLNPAQPMPDGTKLDGIAAVWELNDTTAVTDDNGTYYTSGGVNEMYFDDVSIEGRKIVRLGNFTVPSEAVYNGTSQGATFTDEGTGQAQVSYLRLSTSNTVVSSNSLPPADAGTYEVRVGVNSPYFGVVATNAARRYTDSTVLSANYTIRRATPAIAWSHPAALVYGTPLSAVQLNATSTVTGSYVYQPTNGAVLNAGTNTLVVTLVPLDTNNYSSSSGTNSLLVNPATLTATAVSTNRNYGSPNPAFKISYAGFVNQDTRSVLDAEPTVSTSAATNSPVGDYPITLSGGSDNNYVIQLVNGTLTVNPIPAAGLFSITLPTNLVYNGFAKQVSISSSGPADFSVSYHDGVSGATTNAPIHAGDYTVTATVTDGNYLSSSLTATMTIAKAPQTINFPPPSLANGIVGRSTILTASGGGSGEPVTYTSSVPSVATVSGTTLSFVGVGSVMITASQAGNANYLAAGDQSQNFTVITAWDDWAGGFSLTNGTTRAKNADPDGDGFSNDLEFAFGTSPTNKNQEIFVSHGRVVGGGSTNYVVTFKKRIADVTYDIRSSTNLKLPFTNGTALAIGATNHVDANYVLTTVSLPMTNNRGFIRMKATVNTDPSP